MKQAVIWGAGQGGRMTLALLRADMNVVAICDNNKKLNGTRIHGVPVIDAQQLLTYNPDCIYIAILNAEASIQIKEQIAALGITCEITHINDLRKQFDIRLAALRHISKEIYDRQIEGSVAELGVYQGEFAVEMNKLFPGSKTVFV